MSDYRITNVVRYPTLTRGLEIPHPIPQLAATGETAVREVPDWSRGVVTVVTYQDGHKLVEEWLTEELFHKLMDIGADPVNTRFYWMLRQILDKDAE